MFYKYNTVNIVQTLQNVGEQGEGDENFNWVETMAVYMESLLIA